MVQPNELRVGNWVKHYIDKADFAANARVFVSELPTQVASIWDNGINIESLSDGDMEYISFDDLRPIPITDEILQGCGAVMTSCLTIKAKGADIKIIPGDSSVTIGDEGDFVTTPEGVCAYLHQLQNLYFALTGQELQLKLPSNG